MKDPSGEEHGLYIKAQGGEYVPAEFDPKGINPTLREVNDIEWLECQTAMVKCTDPTRRRKHAP